MGLDNNLENNLMDAGHLVWKRAVGAICTVVDTQVDRVSFSKEVYDGLRVAVIRDIEPAVEAALAELHDVAKQAMGKVWEVE